MLVNMVDSDFYESALSEIGFKNISFVDRNSWYLNEVKTELKAIFTMKEEIIGTVGEEIYHDSWEDFWLSLVDVLKSGELRPTHFLAMK